MIDEQQALIRRAQALEATAARFKALVEATFDVYFDWNVTTGANEFSEQMDRMLGLEPRELPRTYAAWAERLHPDDRERVLALVQRTVEDRAPYTDEYRFRRADGSYIVVEDHGFVLVDEYDGSLHQVGTIRDVTQLRAAERTLRESRELYESLFRNAANPATRVGADGSVLDANAAALELLGTSMETLGGTNLTSHMMAGAAEQAKDALRLGKTARLECDFVSVHGVRHLYLTIVPCRVAGEDSFFILGTDVSDLLALQAALRDSQANLLKQADILRERHTALKVVLEQRDVEREELTQRIEANLRSLVIPFLDKLAVQLEGSSLMGYVDAVRENLQQVVQPLGLTLTQFGADGVPLTPRELEVANLVRAGKKTAEIAECFFVSPETIRFHRRNIRRKLGLEKGGTRLATHLANMAGGGNAKRG